MLIQRLAVDLGTATTRVYASKRGIIVKEPSIVARAVESQSVMAIGSEAEQMLGRTPETLQAERPLRGGVIADYRMTRSMLAHFLSKAGGRFRLRRFDVMVTYSHTATSAERKAVIDAAKSAGGQRVYLIETVVAAALGADVAINEPAGNLIIDIGAGTTEIAVISLGGIVSQASVKIGGNYLSQELSNFIRKREGLIVGESTIESVKKQLATATKGGKQKSMQVGGRDQLTGMPRSVSISNHQLFPVVSEVLGKQLEAVRDVLEATPPELVSDIIDRGVILTGGGSRLTNLDNYLSERLNAPVSLAEDPDNAVVKGAAKALDHLAQYRRSLIFG